jgi:hypothetical protein
MVCAPNSYCCRFESETNDCCSDEASLRTLDAPIGMPLNLPARPVNTNSPDTNETTAVCEDDDSSTIVAVGAGLVSISTEILGHQNLQWQGAGLGVLLVIAVSFLVWQCRRNNQLKHELNEYRYLPKPGQTFSSNSPGPYPVPASVPGYSNSQTPVTMGPPESNPLKPATWKTFLGKNSAESGMMQQEVGGREVLEMPGNTARSPTGAGLPQPRPFNVNMSNSEGSTM